MTIRRMLVAAMAAMLLMPAALQAQQTVRVEHRGLLGFFSETTTADGVTRQVVVDVAPGSPAAAAGLRRGDVIVAINGMATGGDVRRVPMAPGDTVVVRIRRDGREEDVRIVAADRAAAMATVLRPALSDSVLREIAVIMDRVRLEVDTVVFPGAAAMRVERDGKSNVVITFGHDSIQVFNRFPGDSLRVLRSGVSIFAGDSLRVLRSGELRDLNLPEGARVQFRALQGGDTMHITMLETLAAARAQRMNIDSLVSLRPAENFATSFAIGMRAVAGAELSDLNPDLAQYFGVAGGVLVLNAREGTPAARAGVRAGDVIVQVNQTPVASITELRRAMDARPGTTTTLRVLRRGEPIDVTIGRD